MFKQALYTYWTSLHPRNLKYIVDKRWATFILVFVMLPSVSEIKEYGAGAFYPFTVFLPVALMKMSNLVRKLDIPKALFLAPMQEKECKKYIKCLIGIKIEASMLFGLIIQLLWRIIYPISIVDTLICLFAYLSYGIAEYFCIEGTLDDGVKIEHGIRREDGKVTASSCNLLTIAGVALLCMGFLPLSITEESVQAGVTMLQPAEVILLVMMLFNNFIIIVRQYRDMLNTVCKFEPEIQMKKEEK